VRSDGALLQAKAFQPLGLVGDNLFKRPFVHVVFYEPRELRVADGVNVGLGATQDSATLVLISADVPDSEMPELIPLGRIVGPGIARHARRRGHERRALALTEHVEHIDYEHRHDRFADAAAGP